MSQEIFANQSGSYSAELTRRAMFAQYARTAANNPGIIAGGIVGTGDLALSAPGSGMSVNVAPGECIVGGNSGGAQGGYYGRNTAQANLAVTAANATNPRVDTVVATVADAGYGQPSDVGGTTNGLVLAVVTGTATVGATLANLTGAAAVPLSSLVLGYVLVPAASANVTAGNISNVALVSSLGAQNYVQLLAPSKQALASGSVTATWSGASSTSATVVATHNLGRSGSTAGLVCAQMSNGSWAYANLSSATPTTYTIVATSPGATPANGVTVTVFWTAFG